MASGKSQCHFPVRSYMPLARWRMLCVQWRACFTSRATQEEHAKTGNESHALCGVGTTTAQNNDTIYTHSCTYAQPFYRVNNPGTSDLARSVR